MNWPTGPVTARVPATSANLGPGFDSFGLALSLHDTVTARVTPGGVAIEGTGAGAATAGEGHLVIRAMRAAFARTGGQPPGLSLSCQNEIPQGYGLGSSAGAIVAGLLAARALAGDAGLAALPDDALFALATSLEGHPDNVAACLAGGLTIAWTPSSGEHCSGWHGSGEHCSGEHGSGWHGSGWHGSGWHGSGVRVARLTPLPAVAPVLCVPAAPLATEAARKVLPAQVPHADAAANSARAALLVTALTSQPGLLMDATQDFLHQRYRAAAMPATGTLIGALRAAGIPAVISGAGPSVLAFTASAAGPAGACPTGADVAAVAGAADVAWRVLPLSVDISGATVQAG